MSNPEDPQSGGLPFPEDQDAIADAIEERIERLRRLHGWASDTKMVPAQEVEAVVEALDGEIARSKASESVLTLRYNVHGQDNEYELSDERCDIGSGDRADVRVMHPSVSSRHCRISRDGDGFRIRDMNSKTGTFVNDSRIPLSSPLEDGDVLKCGDVEFAITVVLGPNAEDDAEDDAPFEGVSREPAAVSDDGEREESTMAVDIGQGAAGRRSRVAETASRARTSATPRPPADASHAPVAREAHAGAPASCHIVYFGEDGVETEVEVPRDRPLVAGRKSSADLRLTDRSMSSRHAAFEWVDGEVVVRDLGSTNGTWVHGERVPRAVLTDQAVVRLGLVPVRIRFSGQGAVAAEAAPAPEPTRAPEPDGGGPSMWHLVYVTDRGAVASIVVDDREPCVVAGEAEAEISVQGRGLKPEHLQFDWTEAGLEVMQARRDAPLKVNGETVATAKLRSGDAVAAGSLVIRVVRGPALDAVSTAASSATSRRWAHHLRAGGQDLELLFIDAEAKGGRAELSIWGDGAAQVELHTGAAQDRNTATVAPEFQQVLFDALVSAGYPEVPPGVDQQDAAGPELYTFWAEERAEIVLSDGLAEASPEWREVRQLLRAVVDHIIG